MRILVTGAAGFLGSHITDRLLADGHDVIGVDDFSTGQHQNLPAARADERFRLIEGDVTSPSFFDEVRDPLDKVVHLAARKIPRYGSALATLTVNFDGTRVALDIAREHGAKAVLASTSDVYGRNPDVPFNEATSDSVIGSSKSARWSYALSKLVDEHLALAYQEDFGFPVALLRFFGSYGPRQHLSWRGGPQSVFIDQILEGKPLTIHGDGQQTRTFTYVADTVEAIHRTIFDDASNGEIINVGSTDEVTILELARLIHELCETGRDLEIDLVPYESFTGKPYQDVMRRVPDTSLAAQLLGFRAETSLADGLKRTIEWQRSVRG